MTMRIRKYRPGDEAAAYHVCMKTGDHGKDGEPFFSEDPGALGRIYVEPYLRFSPKFALMLEDDEGVCGYALGVLDSRSFFQKYDEEWRPELMRKYPHPTGDSDSWSRIESVYHLYHHPDYFCPEPYEDYPAHLHIDLLPRAQGRGYGRQMIEQLLQLLRDHGAVGVHLGMSAINEPAFRFYRKLGFHELNRDDESIYLGMKLSGIPLGRSSCSM